MDFLPCPRPEDHSLIFLIRVNSPLLLALLICQSINPALMASGASLAQSLPISASVANSRLSCLTCSLLEDEGISSNCYRKGIAPYGV